MARIGSPIEIVKLLDGSNCRQCGKPTCMAFAVAVCNGQKQLSECPKLGSEIVEQHGGGAAREVLPEEDLYGAIARLSDEIAAIDLASAAARLGASFAEGRLTIKCLGRDFSVDTTGKITTSLHVHGWLAVPALQYILDGGSLPTSGVWVSYRDLEGGQARYPLFAQRCEKPCKELADADVELFEDIVRLFGRPTRDSGSAQLSLVLKPLPRLPILIRYWKPEDGLESNLSFLFDSTAAANLKVESIYVLATGLVLMFQKIAQRHCLRQAGR